MNFRYFLLFLILFSGHTAFTQPQIMPQDKPDYQEVLKYHLNELKKNPQNLESTMILMETYYQLEDFRKALLYANIAQDIYENKNNKGIKTTENPESLLFYILHTRGKSRHKLGDYRKAKSDYMEALGILPSDNDLLVDIGNLYYNMQEYDSALYFFKRAEQEFKDGFKAKFNMANTYYVLQEYDSALYYYDESIKIKDDFPYSYFYKGTILNELGSYEKAIISLNKAIRIWPDKSEIYFRRGFALQSLGRYQDAILDWNTVILLDSINLNALRNRAIAYAEIGKKREALSDLDHLIEMNPEEAQGHYIRGRIFYRKKKYAKALPDLESAIKKDIQNGELFFLLGDLYRRKKNFHEACKYLSKANEMEYPLNKINRKFLKKCDIP